MGLRSSFSYFRTPYFPRLAALGRARYFLARHYPVPIHETEPESSGVIAFGVVSVGLGYDAGPIAVASSRHQRESGGWHEGSQ